MENSQSPPADGDLDALGFTYRAADLVDRLPRMRKFTHWGSTYQAHRFEWTSQYTLLFSTRKRITEFDLRSAHGWSGTSSIEHPIVPWTHIINYRDEACEIAVTKICYHYEEGSSEVEIWYLTPRGQSFPLDSYVQMTRRYNGSVYSPRIIDDQCILALVDYQTPYPWDEGYHYRSRTAVCNLLSGRLVLLPDAGRLSEPDTIGQAYLSLQCNAIAYWVCPPEGAPRLSVQYLDIAPLRMGSTSLKEELERNRVQRREEGNVD